MVSYTKLDWKFLKQFNFDRPPKIVLGRSSIVNEKYNRHNKELKELDISIEDYINTKYFKDYNIRFYLDKNKFPYYCESNIDHYVIWINGSSIYNLDKIDEGIYRDFICYKLFDGNYEKMIHNCIYFENIKELRSIKGVSHLHVFIRNV